MSLTGIAIGPCSLSIVEMICCPNARVISYLSQRGSPCGGKRPRPQKPRPALVAWPRSGVWRQEVQFEQAAISVNEATLDVDRPWEDFNCAICAARAQRGCSRTFHPECDGR